MNKSIFALLLATAFTLLFYHQSLGLNVLLYAMLVVLVLVYKKTIHTSSLVTIPFLLAALAVAYHGNTYAILIVFAAFAMLAAHLNESRLDPFVAVSLAVPNFLFAPFRLLLYTGQGNEFSSINIKKLVSYVVIPLIFLILFTALYANSNPIFEKLLQEINWDFIRIDLVWIFILGLIFSGFLFYYYVPPLFKNAFHSGASHIRNLTETVEADEEEGLMKHTWTLVLATLSVLLCIVLLTDMYYRFVLHELPQGLTLSSYLHKGVFALILSILAAILLISFIFRRPTTKYERIAAFSFMILNIIYLLLNGDKNAIYIAEYGLTMKRIGVYLYLLITLVGIATAVALIPGIIDLKSIYRYNTFSVFYLLVLFAIPDWSRIITRHNLNHPAASTGMIDYYYLLQLSDNNTDLLLNADLPEHHREDLRYRLERVQAKLDEKRFLSRSFSDHYLNRALHILSHEKNN